MDDAGTENSEATAGRASTYVVAPLKLVYVGLPKVACTSMKWMVAELAGEDPLAFRRALKSAPTRRQTIHFREAWQHAPRMRDLPRDSRRAVSAANGWFVWAMVRDPRERFWSAWQSKLLVRNPGYIARYANEPWFPRVPRKPEHVVEDFARFVDAFAEGRVDLRGDHHFVPQADLLDAQRATDPVVYDLTQSDEFRADLARHLAAYGRTVPDTSGNDNETPLRLTSEALSGGVAETIESIFARDFERFGHFWTGQPRTVPLTAWSPGALADVATRVRLHARLRDLRRVTRRLDRRLRSMQALPTS